MINGLLIDYWASMEKSVKLAVFQRQVAGVYRVLGTDECENSVHVAALRPQVALRFMAMRGKERNADARRYI